MIYVQGIYSQQKICFLIWIAKYWTSALPSYRGFWFRNLYLYVRYFTHVVTSGKPTKSKYFVFFDNILKPIFPTNIYTIEYIRFLSFVKALVALPSQYSSVMYTFWAIHLTICTSNYRNNIGPLFLYTGSKHIPIVKAEISRRMWSRDFFDSVGYWRGLWEMVPGCHIVLE